MKTTNANLNSNTDRDKKGQGSNGEKKDAGLPATDRPLAEKDEVKQAEVRTQEAQNDLKKDTSDKQEGEK